MTLGGILIATVAAGCYGGGGSSQPYGYNSSYGGYGSSHPYSGYRQNDVSSYHGGYQNTARVDENRDRHVATTPDRVVTRTETQHANVDHDKVSLKDSAPSPSVRN